MRSGRHVWLAGALLTPALILGGVAPRAPIATSGSVIKAGDIVFTRSALSACPDNTQITQLKPDGTLTDLSDCRSEDQMPAVSPDGSKIVYQSLGHVAANGASEPVLDGLYVMRHQLPVHLDWQQVEADRTEQPDLDEHHACARCQLSAMSSVRTRVPEPVRTQRGQLQGLQHGLYGGFGTAEQWA